MKKTTTQTSVQASNGLKELLLDTDNTIPIATAKDSLNLIFQQCQRDTLSSAASTEEGWATMKALETLHDTILLFAVEGAKDLISEKTS
tara:strand:- start:2097 stop:2363 length:267 start_codon:yes stop_codon:yes gene_type:complete